MSSDFTNVCILLISVYVWFCMRLNFVNRAIAVWSYKNCNSMLIMHMQLYALLYIARAMLTCMHVNWDSNVGLQHY